MININTIEDIEALVESEYVEIKSAQGQDGKGTLPKDFWYTYSAMANAKGGVVILGVSESDNKFSLIGIKNPIKIKKDLFTMLENPEKVNVNLLTEKNFIEKTIDGKIIILIIIPQATRDKKPIFLHNNIANSYYRINDSDIKCSQERLTRMFFEKDPAGCDSKILTDFSYNDINEDSLIAYRNLLSARDPSHPYLQDIKINFLKKIGGWKIDRTTKKEGPTLAGLLMFGHQNSIIEISPKFALDYQERPEAKAENRWVDRVYYDGTWSGNVFDFYMKVYNKLIANLNVPFKIKDGVRQDDTGIHQALREALVNTLVHADYLTGRISILIVKRPDLFGFRNPGLMLVPKIDAITHGLSECRNPCMHQMFYFIGLGERAGSGLRKIYQGWNEANWKLPKLVERNDIEQEQTLLELSTTSLIPHNIVDYLIKKFSYNNFSKLDDFEKMILATAAQENWINHQRACELTSKHPREVTLALPNLERKGFLISQGEKKNKIYKLFGEEELLMPEDILNNNDSETIENGQTYRDVVTKINGSLTSRGNNSGYKDNNSGYKDNNSGYKDNNSGYKDINSGYKDNNSDEKSISAGNKDSFGRIIDERVAKPFIFDLRQLDNDFLRHLEKIAEPATKKRIKFEKMNEILISLCKGHYISLSALAELVNRTPDRLRQGYVKKLTEDGIFRMAFPHMPNIPKQGYTTEEECES